MKQTTISRKQENKAWNGVESLTGQLSQTLKLFDGIYSRVLPDTDGLTVEAFMETYGVHRFVTPKGVKKGYTPALINAAWNENMLLKSDEGKVMGNRVFKPIVAKYYTDEERGKSLKVYASEEEALKADGQPIRLYALTQVPCDQWSIKTIKKGLRQSKDYEKEKEKANESEKKWDAVTECWVVLSEGDVRVAKQVSKDRVVF